MEKIFCTLTLLILFFSIASAQLEVTYSKELEQRAEAGDVQAMEQLGYCYHKGAGVTKDFNKAQNWYMKAAEKGNVVAMRRIGSMHFWGEGFKKDEIKAIEWWTRASDAGDTGSMFNIGTSYYNGEGVVQDYSKALFWYKKAAEKDDCAACNSIGVMYNDGIGVPKSYSEAIKWYQKAIDNGGKDCEYAMHNLANIYLNGNGINKNYIKAIELYKQAAERGSSESMHQLGAIYYNGDCGVTKNIGTAIEWFGKASTKEADDTDDNKVDDNIEIIQYICQNLNKDGKYNSILSSMTNLFNTYKRHVEKEDFGNNECTKYYWGLAVCYIYGIGTPINLSKASDLLDDCNVGSPYYSCNAARIYEDGVLGYVDYKKALDFYEYGISATDIYSPAKAATFYLEGKGVKKDIKKAIDLINFAINRAEEFGTTAPYAKYLLGKLYLNGIGVKKNETKAFSLFKESAEDQEEPDCDAMQMLNSCYRFGLGTKKNLKKANYWFEKAQKAGSRDAQRIQDLLRE